MANVDFGGRNYSEYVSEVSSVAEELLRNGAQVTAVHGAVEFYGQEVFNGADYGQLARFSGRVAWEGATPIINDPEADPTEAYEFLGAQQVDLSHALSLAEYGKDLDKYNDRPERAHTVLKMASEAFVKVWGDMRDRPLPERVAFYAEEYVRVASLQNWAGDRDGEEQTAANMVEAGEALFKEAHESGDEELISAMNDALIEIAGSLKGGVENPASQHILRITTDEHRSIDFLELRKLEDTADTLLKCGMIDAAFAVYKLTQKFDPEAVRQDMKQSGRRTDEEIDEHIRLVTGSFPGDPWDTILYLQEQPETEGYVDQILNRIVEEYPTTFEFFSYANFLGGSAAYNVLINVDRAEELAAIVRGNYSKDSSSSLLLMAGRMAAMIMQGGKQELYDKVYEATKDVPGASEALQTGYDAVTKAEE